MSASRLGKAINSAVRCIAVSAVAFPLANAQQTPTGQRWIASWTSAQQIPEPQNTLPASALEDITIRQVFRLSAGGTSVRIHLTNAFGTDDLQVTSAHIAKPVASGSSAIQPATDAMLTFAGSGQVTIPPGAEFLSDPISFPATALSEIAVSFHLKGLPSRQTGHSGSRATSWWTRSDQTASAVLQSPQAVEHWYQVSAIDVLAGPAAATIVALGDSITDGHGTTTDRNERWTDVLASRLQASSAAQQIGVSNRGIGGNHLLTDGLGPNALARFDRDVLATAGVRWLILLEGINDLGALARTPNSTSADHVALVGRVIAAYEQIILRAHAEGIRIIGATLTPYAGSDYYHPDTQSEADRQQVNAWIRTPGHFDAIVDWDQSLRDPSRPDHFLPAFDSGDHLHPSVAGYRQMGVVFPISLFTR